MVCTFYKVLCICTRFAYTKIVVANENNGNNDIKFDWFYIYNVVFVCQIKNWFTICSTETSKGGSVMDGTMTEHKFYFQSGSILFTIRFLILVSYATDRFYGVGMQSHFWILCAERKRLVRVQAVLSQSLIFG